MDYLDRFIGLVLLICSVVSTCLAGRALFSIPIVIVDSFMTVFSAMTLAIAVAHVFRVCLTFRATESTLNS